MPAGPCCLCGATNYAMSMGGPTICPSCDCGNAPHIGNPSLLATQPTPFGFHRYPTPSLTEERVREIIREEIAKFLDTPLNNLPKSEKNNAGT